MKMIFHFRKYQLLSLVLILLSLNIKAQNYNQLSLKEALEIGLNNNKAVQISRLKNSISETKEKDLKMEKLPNIELHTNYTQVSNLHQYQNGIFDKSTEYDAINGMYDFTLSASIPIYLGGKLKNNEKKAKINTENSKLKTQLDERELKMQIITAFLQIHHLKEQQSLIQQKMKEDSANIKETKILKQNGVVTYNEVLRTSLQLSNHKMSWTELDNDIQIAEHQLKTLLSLPDNQELHVETTELVSEQVKIPYLEDLNSQAITENESIEVSKNNIRLAEIDKKIVKGNYLPNITMGGEYWLKYPNMLFFPPEPYAYRLGMLGVTLIYPIENLYKNKYKMQEAKQHIDLANLELEEKEEQLKHVVFQAYKKYEETEQKVNIAQEAIAQAEENYRIVKTKYANKLSLITELIDADNAYLEAESNLISVKINRQLKYYQLQYIIGKL